MLKSLELPSPVNSRPHFTSPNFYVYMSSDGPQKRDSPF